MQESGLLWNRFHSASRTLVWKWDRSHIARLSSALAILLYSHYDTVDIGLKPAPALAMDGTPHIRYMLEDHGGYLHPKHANQNKIAEAHDDVS